MDLDSLVMSVRSNPGLVGKRHLQMVSRIVGGDGEDAAVIAAGAERLAFAAEAISPELVRAAPRVAGIAGVVATLNDIAATGAAPLALLDTVVGAEPLAEEVLSGVRAGADLYGVPLVGGHTTVDEGHGAALSVAAIGRCSTPLRVARASVGDVVSVAICTEGALVGDQGGMPFFSHLRGPRRSRAAQDLALLPMAAAAGELWSARDVSMPGLVGSLIQMLEPSPLGCSIDLAAIPRPAGVGLGEWMLAFMSYGFILIGDPERLEARFAAAGIPFSRIGVLDETRAVELRHDHERRPVWDFTVDSLTGF